MAPRQSTPVPPCPDCQHPEGAWLRDISVLRGVNCFYCPACRQIWQAAERETVPIRTTAPDAHLDLHCASCDTVLTVIHHTIGSVVSERRDQYACDRCGAMFEYGYRTGKLKRSA